MSVRKAVSTQTLALAELIDAVTENLVSPVIIYDEALTIETALTKLRDKRQRDGDKTKAEFPLWSFKRDSLKFVDYGMGRRSSIQKAWTPPSREDAIAGAKPALYNMVQGSIDVDFVYYCQSMAEEEEFEIDFMSESGLSAISELSVEMPDLGIFKYFLKWSPLSSKEVNSKDIYYKAIKGKVEVTGFYFTVDGPQSLITQINARIEEFNNTVLGTITIVPTGTTLT